MTSKVDFIEELSRLMLVMLMMLILRMQMRETIPIWRLRRTLLPIYTSVNMTLGRPSAFDAIDAIDLSTSVWSAHAEDDIGSPRPSGL